MAGIDKTMAEDAEWDARLASIGRSLDELDREISRQEEQIRHEAEQRRKRARP